MPFRTFCIFFFFNIGVVRVLRFFHSPDFIYSNSFQCACYVPVARAVDVHAYITNDDIHLHVDPKTWEFLSFFLYSFIQLLVKLLILRMQACCQDLLLSEYLRICLNEYFSLSWKWTPILAMSAHVSASKMSCISRCHLLLRSMQDVQGRVPRQTRKRCELHQRFVLKLKVFSFTIIRDIFRPRKIFEFHLAHWASTSQILLARGTSPLAQVFKLINNSWTQKWKSNYRRVLMLQ